MPPSRRLLSGILAAMLLVAPAAVAEKRVPPMPDWRILDDTPQGLAEGFIRWYLECMEELACDPVRAPRELQQQFLTQAFISRLNTPFWSASPFIQAQDTAPDWASSVSASDFSSGEGTASVIVTMGVPPETDHVLLVHFRLQPDGQSWRIDWVERVEEPIKPLFKPQ
ncbi:MAG TPA: hypothetical protein VED40_00755 [Azospirillaceae bacterium]|nr:hypothetical protein [Azospirillaceae bacterium]